MGIDAKKYGLLEFELENRNEIFKDMVHKNFNPLKAVGKNLYKESLEYLEDEYDIEGINTVIPIGENDNGNMLILCTEDNVLSRTLFQVISVNYFSPNPLT